MKTLTTESDRKLEAIESALVQGDLSKLNSAEKVSYNNQVCESLGLNPLTKPFEYIKLNGRLVLYAKRDATDQLRKVHGVSIHSVKSEKFDDIYVVTASARDATGREDSSTGAVSIAGLKGDALANAIMKAETKAKRRVTLSICGLGILDETEVETIPEARKVEAETVFAPGDDSEIDPLESIGNYVCQIGRNYKGQRLRDIDPAQLKAFTSWLKAESAKQGKELQNGAKELVEHAEVWLSEGGE